MIGIDYSITSPSVYIGDSNFDNGKVLCFGNLKKIDSIRRDVVTLCDYPEWNTKEQRYYLLAKRCVDFIIDNTDERRVRIEGYAYAAIGNVFDIAEATSVLKQILYHNGFTIEIIEPKVVKKLATGKGNANKLLMYEKFSEKWCISDYITGLDLSNVQKKIPSPVTDIIDSYFVATADKNPGKQVSD